MEEKFKKFSEFNWQQSEEWQSYYRNLYPTPPGNKIDKFKRKFYKLKIDPDFDINYNAQDASSTPSSGSSQNTQQSFQSSTPPTAINSPLLFNLETILLMLFTLSCPFNFHTIKLSSLSLLWRTIRLCGKPKWDMTYAQGWWTNDSFHMLMYSVLLFLDRFNYFLLIPLLITAIVVLCENCKSMNIPQLAQYSGYFDKVNNNKTSWIQTRAHVEVAIGFWIVIGIFLKTNSFMLPIIYWQFMKVKYVVNPNIQTSFYMWNQYVNTVKNNPNVPGVVKMVIEKVQWVFEYMGKVDTQQQGGQQGQQGGQQGSGCNVF